MGHSVFKDSYGRLFYLPEMLSKYCSVVAVVLDYRLSSPPSPCIQADRWLYLSIPRTLLTGWLWQLVGLSRRVRPSALVASSDCFCIVLGWLVAKVVGAKLVVDLYDDYLAFGLAKVPFVKWLYLRALKRADLIVVVSSTLAEDILAQLPNNRVHVLESTVPHGAFFPTMQADCRFHLQLPILPGCKFVGICGGLNRHHGIQVVYDAIIELAQRRSDVVVVIAGSVDEALPLPNVSNIFYLGTLPHSSMNAFYGAMDAVLVSLSDSRFGRFAFPQKAYEILATKTPIVAANVGALGRLLERWPEVLYNPNSPEDLAAKIEWQVDNQQACDVDIPTWEDQAAKLYSLIERVLAGKVP